jgi:hypothetical protein
LATDSLAVADGGVLGAGAGPGPANEAVATTANEAISKVFTNISLCVLEPWRLVTRPGGVFGRTLPKTRHTHPSNVPAIVGKTIIYRLFDRLFGLAGPLLNAAYEFVFTTFHILKIVIGQLGESLFQFAFGNVPVSFGLHCIHNF